MKIDLNRSDGSTTEFEIDIPMDDIDLESEFARVEGSVRAEGEVSNEESLTVIDAEINAPLSIDCSRCLKPSSRSHEVSFRTAFVVGDEASEEGELELDLRDLELSTSESDEIDLVDVVREQIVLGLPSHPLCSDDCKGLCEMCGGNLNEKQCDCKEQNTDPRWAALRDLK